MARQKSGDKLGDIRVATVAEVVEVGSSAASVNVIAKRAGLSIGTLYRYHANKNALLRSVYLGVKTDIHNNIMDAATRETESYDKIRAMWFAILTYARTKPKDFIFAEVILNAAILSEKETAEVVAMATDISRVIEVAIANRVLRDSPTKVINTLLAAPALQLGRQAAMHEMPLDMDLAEEIFALCWRAVAA
ncbi:MAG: TetR/AcrR family transcriptional regulator [Yoonia sp.]|uniref:TetR/AcrR family transcriptional regulator n=1 Tax=Yoonia sp. TaxID=2212373 RepID=UPI00329995B7